MTKDEFSALGRDLFHAGFSPGAIHVILASIYIAVDHANRPSVTKKYGRRVVRSLRQLKPKRKTCTT